jgi:hypothetical protein
LEYGINIHKYIVLYDCEHRLNMCENKVVTGVFEPKREELAGDWRRLHSEGLHNLCASQNIIRVIKSRMR